MLRGADFDCRNVPYANCRRSLNDNFMEKLLVSKPNAIGYNIVRNSYYDNLN